MKKHIRCVGCGRKHKPGHDKRIGTKLQYEKECASIEDGIEILKQRAIEAKQKLEEEKIKIATEKKALEEKTKTDAITVEEKVVEVREKVEEKT